MLLLSCQLAWQRIRSAPLRATLFLVALVSVFTIHLFIGNIMLQEMMIAGIDAWRESSIFDMYIIPDNTGDIDLQPLQSIQQIDSVSELSLYSVWVKGLSSGLFSLTAEQLDSLLLSQGTRPNEPNQVVISSSVAQQYNIKTGDTLTLALINDIRIQEDFLVSGVLAEGASSNWVIFTSSEGLALFSEGMQHTQALGIKFMPQVNLERASKQLNEIYPEYDVVSYRGVRYTEATGSSMATIIHNIISGLVFLVTALLLAIFSYFSYREYLLEAGVCLSLGMNQAWLSMVGFLSTLITVIISAVVVYLLLPLYRVLPFVDLRGDLLVPARFFEHMWPLFLCAIGVPLVYSITTFESWSISHILKDDWTG